MSQSATAVSVPSTSQIQEYDAIVDVMNRIAKVFGLEAVRS